MSDSTVHSMAFFHDKGMVPAWTQAAKFAGSSGRIATLPDIIDARLSTNPMDFPWDAYFTTLSAEYMGLTAGGTPILIVAHGVGPMATLDGILKSYSYQFRDKSRNKRGGRITTDEFRALESGVYGDVHIVDLSAFFSRYEYPFLEALRLETALREPLALARIGAHADEYLNEHAQHSIGWHLDMCFREAENRFNIPALQHLEHAKRMERHHLSKALSFNPHIIELEDANNCGYGHKLDGYNHFHFPDTGAVAHLLTIGGLRTVTHEGNYSYLSSIHCHEWTNDVRLVGVMDQQPLTDIHKGFGFIQKLIIKNWRSLMIPNPESPAIGMRRIEEFEKGVWFTHTPKISSGIDTHEPEYKITRMRKLGAPEVFRTLVEHYYGFFKYDIREIEAIAPKHANAYEVVSSIDNIWEEGVPIWQETKIQFYRVDVDTSQRLIQPDVLQNDYEKLMELTLR